LEEETKTDPLIFWVTPKTILRDYFEGALLEMLLYLQHDKSYESHELMSPIIDCDHSLG
jgi:hypothetical protein